MRGRCVRQSLKTRSPAAYFPEFENYRNMHLEEFIAIAHEAGVPVIVDASAEIPPVENLTRFTKLGADLTVFSGGKDICGPQSSGLILGRAALIEACALNTSPNYSIGRPMKVGKEEIAGLITALELYLKQDFTAEEQMWEDMVASIVEMLASVPGLHARRVSPGEPGIQPNWIPRVYLDWDEEVILLSREEVKHRLRLGRRLSPSVRRPRACSSTHRRCNPARRPLSVNACASCSCCNCAAKRRPNSRIHAPLADIRPGALSFVP